MQIGNSIYINAHVHRKNNCTFFPSPLTFKNCSNIFMDAVKRSQTWSQFHQLFMSCFYARRSQKHKKDSQLKQLYLLSGSVSVKALCKHVDEIGPWCHFYQHFRSSNCASRFTLIPLVHSIECRAKKLSITSS